MGPLIMAWLVGEGIIVYRSVKTQKAPPGPGQLLIASGAFILLGLLAEAPAARPLAITMAWGLDIAAFMNVIPGSPKAPVANQTKWPPPKAPNNVIFPVGK